MEHDKRIQKILGENRRHNQQNSSRYLDYLKSVQNPKFHIGSYSIRITRIDLWYKMVS